MDLATAIGPTCGGRLLSTVYIPNGLAPGRNECAFIQRASFLYNNRQFLLFRGSNLMDNKSLWGCYPLTIEPCQCVISYPYTVRELAVSSACVGMLLQGFVWHFSGGVGTPGGPFNLDYQPVATDRAVFLLSSVRG